MAREGAREAAGQGQALTCQRALIDHALASHQGSIAGHQPTLLGQHQAVSRHELTGVDPFLLCGQAGASV